MPNQPRMKKDAGLDIQRARLSRKLGGLTTSFVGNYVLTKSGGRGTWGLIGPLFIT